MKIKKLLMAFICSIFVLGYLGGCSSSTTSEDITASNEQSLSNEEPSSSTTSNKEVSSSQQKENSPSSNSQYEVIIDPNGNEALFAPNETGAENIFITPNPNKDSSIVEPPKPDGGKPNII